MKIVFILIAYMTNSDYIKIENLESREACELLASQMDDSIPGYMEGWCFPVKRLAEPDGGAV